VTTHSRPLENKTALITGASKRIGKAIALYLASLGANILVHYHTSKEEAKRVVGTLSDQSVKAWALQSDLADPESASQLIGKARTVAGDLHYLINNASIFPNSQLDSFSSQELEHVMQVNAMAPLQLCRDFAKLKTAEHIINLLDTRITAFDFSHAAYDLSKKTLHQLTQSLAIELAPQIRVNAVAPGLILPPADKDHSYLEKLKHTNPLQTYGTPEEIARAIGFLITSHFIQGHVIFVDGGRHLKGIQRG